eukprot:5786285-Alexandrium_andersonii.AAC.1
MPRVRLLGSETPPRERANPAAAGCDAAVGHIQVAQPVGSTLHRAGGGPAHPDEPVARAGAGTGRGNRRRAGRA